MKKRAKKLNWERIWDDFDEWFQAEERRNRERKCSKCGTIPFNIASDWEEQQKAIRRIVEAHR